ncbi:MAG: Xaa-Pro peptidase family protein [Rhodospirillales bacterium]
MPDAPQSPAPPTPETAARRAASINVGRTDSEAGLDLSRLRRERLARVRAELKRRDLAGALLYDPINIRYATGSRNMAVWTLHNAARSCFVPVEGPVILYDYHNCEHLSDGLETIDEVRRTISWYFFSAGWRVEEKAKAWAAEIADLIGQYGGGNRRLAIDKCDMAGTWALEAQAVELHDGQEVMEQARLIKSDLEIQAMTHAIAVAEIGMTAMHQALKPGISENRLWSLLHRENIARGGEWIETRLLSAGRRTNPWFQECSAHLIRPGDLVSFDTDLIGPFGYCADVSRTFHCGPGKPTAEQKRLYGLAYEQIETNVALLKPGMTFREVSEKSWKLPSSCNPNRYSVVIHGVGLCDEYPSVYYSEDWESFGYDGEIQPGMTLCVESYIGEAGGDEGVKLEQQVLVTESGVQVLSHFPFEEDLLPSRWV